MPVIFISYRREDSAGHAGRLFDRLREHFGKDRVFLDVVGIDAGVDFVETIDKAVGSCDVLLAVIGREWLTCCDKQGRRRLDDPNDFIRAEISAALNRNVRVVPVLVEGAEMPPTDALPEELKRLTRRQAVELRDSRWDDDVESLISALERDASSSPPRPAAAPAPMDRKRTSMRPALLWGIVIAVLAAAWILLTLFMKIEEPQTGQTPEPKTDTRIEVPNLVGTNAQQAIDTLRNAGLDFDRKSETSSEPKYQVLRQEPAAGSRVEKGTRVTLIYAVPPKENTPAPTSVSIYYANEADRETAEGLVDYLTGLSLRGVSYKTLQSRWLEPGKLYYSSEENARLANSIASRSGSWLSDRYRRRVRIEVEQNSRIARTGLVLALPSSQAGAGSRRPS